MSKSDYRLVFKDLSYLIKFNHVLKLVGVDSGAFTRFVSGQDNAISLDKCERIYNSLGVLLQNSYNIHYQLFLMCSYC